MNATASVRRSDRGRRLVAILANPPLTTSGRRTSDRVTLAAALLGCDSVRITNLFAASTSDVTQIPHVGQHSAHWVAARAELESRLDGADCVLLAWGVGEPSGPARHHHRAQVEWLRSRLATTGMASLWTIGGLPRHPSRWQRYTSRAHPGIQFRAALSASLVEAGDLQMSCSYRSGMGTQASSTGEATTPEPTTAYRPDLHATRPT